jgi:hypothetical protein
MSNVSKSIQKSMWIVRQINYLRNNNKNLPFIIEDIEGCINVVKYFVKPLGDSFNAEIFGLSSTNYILLITSSSSRDQVKDEASLIPNLC